MARIVDREPIVVVATVAALYGHGDPKEFEDLLSTPMPVQDCWQAMKVIPEGKRNDVTAAIYLEVRMEARMEADRFRKSGKDSHAQRLMHRVEKDIAEIKQQGWCTDMWPKYGCYFARDPATPPTLFHWMSHFYPSFLAVFDESHLTIPAFG